jgi:hypothetical protein
MAVAYNRYKLVTVSFLKRFRNGCCNYETAVRRFQKRNGHLDPEVVKNPLELLESPLLKKKKSYRNNSFFQGGDDGRGYRNMCKIK